MEEALEGFRLSPQQRRLWASRRGAGISVSWIEARIEATPAGDLDVDALRAALGRVVERNEALRTTFPVLSGMSVPLQVVAAPDFVWEDGDGGGQDFDLSRGPLLRARLATVSPQEHRLRLSVPALCCDGLSLFHVLDDLAREYAGQAEDGAEPPMQAIDFSEWQNELLESEEGGEPWRRQSAQGLDGWRLPAEVAAAASGASASVEIRLENTDTAEKLAAATGVPLPAVFLAVWQTLLGRLTGQGRLVVGAAFDGRPYQELARSVGFLARSLPLACDLGEAGSFRELAARTGAAWNDAAKWQESFSWERFAQAEGGVRPDALFRAGFRFDDRPAISEHDGLRISVAGWDAPFEPIPLELRVRRADGALAASLVHDPALLAVVEARRLADQYQTLLASALATPDAPLDDLELLPADERRALLVDFNATATAQETGLLHHRFAAQAAHTPDAPAAVAAGRSLAFAELDAAANRLARCLRRRGVGPGTLVAVALERSPDLLAALLAVLKAGGAYLPLDAAQPRERLARILESARPPALVTSPRYPGSLPEGLEATVFDLEGDRAEWSAESAEKPQVPVQPEDLAYVLFTSGSTGLPKGVMIPHGGLANYLAWAGAAYPLAAGRGAPVHSPIGFDLTVTSLFLPLLAGRPAVLLPEEPGLGALAGALTEGDFGLAKLTPAHLEALAELVPQDALARSARSLVLGGEALTGERLRPWRAANPELRVFNEYGPTEAVVGCCVYELPPGDPAAGAVPIGRPIANTRLYVLNRRLRPVPAGVPGELYIGGAGVARGYLGQPALTAERFVPDPFGGQGERLYKTGDRVRHGADSQLEFLGRVDHQVKIRGHRVEPGEIEAVLEQHPGVRECAVVARQDGEAAGRRLVAYVIAEADPEPPRAGELRAFLEARLPAYMVPAAFVPLPALPLTTNGKVDRAALPAPGRGRPELEETFVRPQGLEEEVLAEIWAAVLGLESVGSNDSFFALGGDSIRSIQVRSEAEKRGLHFTVQQIFQYPTVRALARELRGESSRNPEEAEDAPIAPFALISEEDRRRLLEDVADAYPVAQLQAGMLFHSELLPGSAIYHDIYTFRLRGPLDLLTLRASLQRLAARHEALRTSFDLSGAGEPLQRVHRHVEIPVEYEDLSDLPAAEQDAHVAAWQADEKLRSFDWSRPPLLRAHVHRLGADAFQFSFGFHHAILDGWSVATMLAELFRAYLSLVAGEAAPPEPPLPIGYRNFVAAEQRALRSSETRRYWEERVGDALRTTLPRRPAVRDSYDEREIQGHTVPFTPQLSEDLKRVARQAGVPLKSVLLAAHFRVLSVLTGQTDVATGMVSNGRIEAEGGERMLGLFLNTLPLRQRLPGGSWLDLVRDAFEVERGSFPHRRFPLAELQRMSGGEPIFETVFNFMHFHVYESVGGLRGLEVTGGDAFEEANFPFAANFSVGGPAALLVLRFDYDARQFDADQIAFFGRVYDRSLHALAADPRARYDHPAPLAEDERLQLLQSGEGEAAAPPVWTVHERLAEIAREAPDALAAVFEEEPGRVWELRYGDLDARSNQLARHLTELGAGRGALVGLCLRRSPELLAGMFGILKAGAAYLPLDPAYPRERLAQILADARVSLVVTDEPAATRLPDPEAHGMRLVLLDGGREAIGRESADPLQLPLCADDAAYVVYTSGSTGVPKGVVATHGGLASFSRAVTAAVGLAPGKRMLQFASIAFDASALQIFPTLTSGATLVLHPDPAGLTSQEIRELCIRLGVTVLDLPGALWRQWVETLAQESLPVPESVEVYMTGGERLTGETLRLWARILPGDGLFLSSYGPTEATITTLFFSALASRVSFDPRYEPPLGRPLPATRIRLLDAAGEPVPECVPGELYIGGAGLARGYLHRPDLTAERFVPDPFAGLGGEPGARLYRTGDLARPLPDGGFEFQGRTDHQVKIRGFRVEPGEIEAVLARHPAVREAVVLPREDRPGQKRLVAYLLIDPQVGAPEVADLRAHVGRFLPDYMVPSAFLALDELPLLPSGKVDRRALPAVDAVGLALGSGYAAPRTPVEEIVAGIWAKVIGAERVGAHDNFFELGGHSLLATQVITRIRQTLEIDLPLRALFEAPTVEGLTAVILADPEQRAKVERTAELTVQLAGLSEDEVERMLLAESGLESNLT